MTIQDEAPLDAPAPEDSDARPRIADTKPITTDPDAPYGWMKDPKTGEMRPKRRPGRQKSDGPKPPPATGRPRRAIGPPPNSSYQQLAGELLSGTWMLIPPVASLPFVPESLAIRLKAQAHILHESIGGLANALGQAAEHNETAAKYLTAATSGGQAWIVPAMAGVIPFVAMSASMWRAPLSGDVEQLAKATDATWEATVNSITAKMAQDSDQPPA